MKIQNGLLNRMDSFLTQPTYNNFRLYGCYLAFWPGFDGRRRVSAMIRDGDP
jgi:hypothetical protein